MEPAGEWQLVDRGENGQLSVEEGIAGTLGIHLGDMLTYDVAGSVFTAKVTSLRKVQWDSMKVNFFVIATPDLLRDYPASYRAASTCRRTRCARATSCRARSPTCC